MKRTCLPLAGILLLMLLVCRANSESYSIQWYSMNCGGGDMSSPSYTMKASVGQSAANIVSSPDITHYIGYWAGSWGYGVTGRVVLQDYLGDFTLLPIRVEFRGHGGATTTRTVWLDMDSDFTLIDVEPDVYDMAFKASHWLQKVVPDVVVEP